MSVEHSPTITTFAPRLVAPAAKALAKPGDESLMSWPTASFLPDNSSSSANAAPKHSTTCSVS